MSGRLICTFCGVQALKFGTDPNEACFNCQVNMRVAEVKFLRAQAKPTGRKCRRCEAPLGRDRYFNCGPCELVLDGGDIDRPETPPVEVIGEKACRTCGETKSYTEYYRQHTAADGFRVHCKECMAARMAQQKEAQDALSVV